MALELSREKNINVSNILVDYQNLIDIINVEQCIITWRFQHMLNRIRTPINVMPEVIVNHIPRNLNDFADKLASYARSNPGLSLFHRGMQLPHWINIAAAEVGFCF